MVVSYLVSVQMMVAGFGNVCDDGGCVVVHYCMEEQQREGGGKAVG